MSNIVIKKHNFDKAKNNIKQFSLMKPEQLALEKVDVSGGLFNWFDHKVTGVELNSLTSQIQDYLIKFNNLNTKLVKEFGEVYNALDALDNEYIKGILISVKAAEQASMEAKDAQKDINRTIEVQKQTLRVLESFKNKLDKFKYLESIDEVWEDTQRFSVELRTIIKQIKKLNEDNLEQTKSLTSLLKFKSDLSKQKRLNSIDTLWDDAQESKRGIESLDKILSKCTSSIESQSETIITIKSFTDKLNKLEHILQIDEIWNNMQVISKSFELLNKRISQIESDVKKNTEEITYLNQYIESLKKLEHLFDIDEVWESTQKLKDDVASINQQITEIHKTVITHEEYIEQTKVKTDLLQVKVTNLEKELVTMIKQMDAQKEQYENGIQHLMKKNRNSMLLGTSSLILVVILYVLNIAGIL